MVGQKSVRITPLVWTTLDTKRGIARNKSPMGRERSIQTAVAFAVVLSSRRQLTEVLLMCFVSDYEETELQP